MKISIIVPCRNERQHITQFLDAVFQQELEADDELEILVAEGESDDGTLEAISAYAQAQAHNCLRIIHNPERIVSTGLNSAILQARGDIVIRMDVHTTYAPDYVRECKRVLQETGADSVGGPWVAEGRSIIGQAIASAFHSRFCSGGARGHNRHYEGEVDTVYLGCWRREAFFKAGLFDPDLVRNQDDEFHFRLRRGGGRIWQSPRIRSVYSPRESLTALFKQYLQYGFWKVAVLRKHKALASWRHAVPALFVASVLLGILGLAATTLMGANEIRSALLGLLELELLVYLLCCIAASVPFIGTASMRAVAMMPLVIAVYHVSYGIGSIAGLFSLLRSKKAAAGQSRLFTALSR